MNLTIKGKLISGFGLLLALNIGTGLFMVGKLSEANNRINDLVNVSEKKISLSHELYIAVLNETRFEKNLIMEQDPAKQEYDRNRIYAQLGLIDSQTHELQGLVDADGNAILNKFNQSWNAYKNQLNTLIALTISGQRDKAFNISVGDGARVKADVTDQMARLVEKNEKSMATDKARSDANYASAFNMVMILIISGIVIAVALAYRIIQNITGRITLITGEAEKIASRQLSDSNLENNNTDELSAVFEALTNINESFKEITENANKVAKGDYAVDFVLRSDRDVLGRSLKMMTQSLRETTAANEKHNWLTAGQNLFSGKLMGNQGIKDLTTAITAFLCDYTNASAAALYLADNKNILRLTGAYALTAQTIKESFALNEGVAGQAAFSQEAVLLNRLHTGDIRIASATLEAVPEDVYITPILFNGKLLGIIEIASLHGFSETQLEFINNAMESIAVNINSALARERINELLEETQVQSEEMKQMNEELQEQTQSLKQQQEELQMTNEELEEQTQSLELKNKELETARQDIEQKSRQLEVSSKYKSEFLANMSHELRTPLNSLLILSKDLSENKQKNLTDEQVESAGIIYKSGTDLLTLINEVLDLSKIEAGKMNVNAEDITVKSLMEEVMRDFRRNAAEKGLQLRMLLTDDAPQSIHTDPQRLKQILKNLLSNAIKFTEKGSVTLSADQSTGNMIRFRVTDTGIGIPEDKQLAVFEAFQQADGGTSRKYGGTGLGLSISRELARLLHGDISLNSTPGKGSTFTLTISAGLAPQPYTVATETSLPAQASVAKPATDSRFLNYPTIGDDRNNLQPDDRLLLIVEDDLKFAAILQKQARAKGFKCLTAATGEDGLKLTALYKPHAIMLDLDLPGISGRQVLTLLKSDPALRHIPVHIVSVNERTLEPIKEGAVEYLVKPVDKNQLDEIFSRIENFVNRKMKNLLIVEDDENARKAIRKLIGNGDVKCFEAGNGQQALEIFNKNDIDCIVLDIGLPDISGTELIYRLEKTALRGIPPIVIYTGRELSREENEELQKYTETIIIKGVKSEERLLDETALFLHRTISNLPEAKQQVITRLHDQEAIFRGKKILLADDDMRNVFALSKILREHGMDVIKADNGKNALELLLREKNVDLILMDIMMPQMDGYEAMRLIRAQPGCQKVPIIALTAKAMKDDKQKCIDAGANDYIAKPVDVTRLLSLMRVWMSK